MSLTGAGSVDTVLGMNDIPLAPEPSENPWLDRFQAIIEVLLLSGLVSGFFAALPFSIRAMGNPGMILGSARVVVATILLEAGICFVLLWLLLRLHRETLKDLSFHLDHWSSDVALGVTLVPVLFLANFFVTAGFRFFLPRYYVDRNPLTEIIRTPAELALFIGAVLVAGGIKEEVQRAFILTRFRQHLGGSTLGLLLWSVVFGAQHYVQGLQGIVAATLFGLLFGAVYLIRRSLLAPIVTHAVYDTAALLGYWFSRDVR
jgi:membrane protease YdiL (CAAX protease family)